MLEKCGKFSNLIDEGSPMFTFCYFVSVNDAPDEHVIIKIEEKARKKAASTTGKTNSACRTGFTNA